MRPQQGELGGGRGRLPDWSELALPLPRVMGDHIASISRRPGNADNVGLWLDKLVYRRRSGWTLDGRDRSFSLGQLCRQWHSAAGKEVCIRLEETVKTLHPTSEQRVHLRAQLNGRLMVDHGRAAAAETSVSFHPMWGVPRIPGSALKGVTRGEMRMDGVGEPVLVGMFGGEKTAGRVLFYDALPVDGRFELALDVLTPHHRDYYEGSGLPAEWDSPVPVTFLTVVETTFDIWLGARSSASGDVEALEQAAGALQQAMELTGVGGKTGAGYGRFLVERR